MIHLYNISKCQNLLKYLGSAEFGDRKKRDGTPDRRTAGHRGNAGCNPLRAKHIEISDSVTIVGKVVHRRRGFDPATLSPALRREWIATLEHGKALAQAMVYDFLEAQRVLSG